jgi:hypothetical protein
LAFAAYCANGRVTAATVYSQSPQFPGSNFASWTSSGNSSYQEFDNFTLTNPANITSITWQGFDFDAITGASDAMPASFTFSFFTDSGNLPGTLVGSETISNYSDAVAGDSYFFGTNFPIQNIYNYSADLSSSISLFANTNYWVSVEGNTTGENYFTWTSGTGGDGLSVQALPTGGYTTHANDEAFSLVAAAPETSGLVAFGLSLLLGVATLAVTRPRKAKPIVA